MTACWEQTTQEEGHAGSADTLMTDSSNISALPTSEQQPNMSHISPELWPRLHVVQTLVQGPIGLSGALKPAHQTGRNDMLSLFFIFTKGPFCVLRRFQVVLWRTLVGPDSSLVILGGSVVVQGC